MTQLNASNSAPSVLCRDLTSCTDLLNGLQSLSYLVGEKGARLAEITKLQLRVAPWFCVTTEAFKRYFQRREPVQFQLEIESIYDGSTIENYVIETPLPREIEEEIIAGGNALLEDSPSGALAVRSSAALEDTPTAAYAGMFDTLLGITDPDMLIRSVKQCWSSLWSKKAIRYHLWPSTPNGLVMAVIVQQLVPASISGVLFTANPVTDVRDEILIESSWGLGESVVGGRVTPDLFTVRYNRARNDYQLASRRLGRKTEFQRWNASQKRIERVSTPIESQKHFTLTESQVLDLVQIGLALQSHFGCPQDIEWAIHEENIYVMQSRPITTLR